MNIPPEWIIKSKNRAEQILSECAELCSPTSPVPILKIIEAYVGDVTVKTLWDYDFPSGISAFATKDGNHGWVVAINGRDSTEHQRFSAAHELAHMALITNQPRKVYCSSDKGSWHEKLCDHFAGYLLMPEKVVRGLYESNPRPYLEDIAKLFKVSKIAAEIQLKSLGLPVVRKEAVI